MNYDPNKVKLSVGGSDLVGFQSDEHPTIEERISMEMSFTLKGGITITGQFYPDECCVENLKSILKEKE
ncbi:hypothetical protein Barba19A_gp005 [Rheinheimera phage vB_RspM_Barba19A]|uniref:Uncharacterized protein n=2 Tax=Barbavirus barba19A TaxID=2734091 RepID=A0A4V1EZY8_9CAUD|nr:hypothetical protein HOV47_gp005 [Rheinheimera phage vB_RspM_Barba19A]QCQ61845.1 hypothetical protein Barba19A_gp005 [Rheinheimera phage vB_RspM_Barba19A]QCQ64595.1 hypothetical protein Barba31A_gp005 [Rheinheimera phage vB_RspM_Barba31A]